MTKSWLIQSSKCYKSNLDSNFELAVTNEMSQSILIAWKLISRCDVECWHKCCMELPIMSGLGIFTILLVLIMGWVGHITSRGRSPWPSLFAPCCPSVEGLGNLFSKLLRIVSRGGDGVVTGIIMNR